MLPHEDKAHGLILTAPAHEPYWFHTRTLHGHELIALAHRTKRSWARTAQKSTLTRTIPCTRAPCSNPSVRAHCKACGRILHKNIFSRTQAIPVPCTGPVRSASSSTHVAPNEALSHAHMLGTRGRTRTLLRYVAVLLVPRKAR